MIKRFRVTGLVLALAAILLGFVGIGSAQAVSDSDISVSFAHTRAYQTNPAPAARYDGVLQVDPLYDCAGGSYKTWTIVFGNGTYGIRATDGPRIITHCDTKPNCEVLNP